MGNTKAPHHKGTYHRRSLALVAAANANPNTICARCGRTLTQHPPTKKTGRPPRWSAGHIIDGQVEGPLQPEVLGCNSSAGARLANARRRRHTSTTW